MLFKFLLIGSSSISSTFWKIYSVLLYSKNNQPARRIKAWIEMFEENQSRFTLNKVVFIWINKLIPESIAIRNIMARKRPIWINFFCLSTGKRLANIDMKIILSIPRTISRKVKVRKATTKSGVINLN